jgi:ATP-dependent DNA helicase RecG
LALRRRMVKGIIKKRNVSKENFVNTFIKNLPFQPTQAQIRVCEEIDFDLQKPEPMNRLLQGDVGSGKTLVAIHALLRTLEQGKNGVLLAPTEILAEQHYTNFKKWVEPMGIQVELWTRNVKGDAGAGLFGSKGIIFVGTHALIQEKVDLPNLGLGIIDEQHKFGVVQRVALQSKAEALDLLVMTATPIPRTLCLTHYGDLDVSILDQIPPGRKAVKTYRRGEESLPKIWDFVKKKVSEGQQAYIVYPLVDESEKMDLKSVLKSAKDLEKKLGEGLIGVLHGKMPGEEKDRVMRRFRLGHYRVLVSTTVVEVGVDVPNATVMVVEHADRFGLAQLHQLRGRVGRGQEESFCILIGDPKNEEGWERLKIMEETTDGFKIAEEDMKIRGPGNIIGTEQSGLPPLRLANFYKDMDLLTLARKEAEKFVQKDAKLQKHACLKEYILKTYPVGFLPSLN